MSVNSCYRLRRAPGAANFAAAWDVALAHAARRLVDLAFERVVHGSDEPVFDKAGNRVGRRLRYSDRLLMYLTKAYLPDRFGHVGESIRHAGKGIPNPVPPIDEAIRRLEPVPPGQPHLLMAPDELATALEVADALNGELPHWHRGRPDQLSPVPRNEEMECMLEQAKHAIARAPELSNKEDLA